MKHDCLYHLTQSGIALDDARALRRIAMTLHRWHELECGDSNDYASWCVTRGFKGPFGFRHDDDGNAYEERHVHTENKARYTRIPDRERGALKRLSAIMAKYPEFVSYVQGDPRGAALYILRPGDVREGCEASSCYTDGIAVYK